MLPPGWARLATSPAATGSVATPARITGIVRVAFWAAKLAGAPDVTSRSTLKQDPNFDYAEGLFQIAIVIASVSIITKARALLWGAAAMGVVALALMLNGFYLFAELPL
jgi:Domain of unknown function (DUF4337)